MTGRVRRRLIQVTPEFPPDRGGVADYAAKCHMALSAKYDDVVTIKLTEDESRSAYQRIDGIFESKEALNEWSTVLFVHFSGYGYAPNGHCEWLVEWLGQVLMGDRFCFSACLFHEVFVDIAWPWSRSFWTRPRQISIAQGLVPLFDRVLVTSIRGQQQLRKECNLEDATVLPVFSTIGEPKVVPPILTRSPKGVWFGGSGKAKALKLIGAKRSKALGVALDFWGIEEIVDVGGSGGLMQMHGRRVQVLGYLEEEGLRGMLLNSRMGICATPQNQATKSSVLAAYEAHGLVPWNAMNPDPTLLNDFAEPSGHGVDLALPSVTDQQIARRYDLRSIEKTVEVISRALGWGG